MIPGVLADARRELAEQVVGDQCPALRRNARARAEGIERGERPLAHGGTIDREKPRNLVVAAASLQHELENGSLIRRQAVEGSHRLP